MTYLEVADMFNMTMTENYDTYARIGEIQELINLGIIQVDIDKLNKRKWETRVYK